MGDSSQPCHWRPGSPWAIHLTRPPWAAEAPQLSEGVKDTSLLTPEQVMAGRGLAKETAL